MKINKLSSFWVMLLMLVGTSASQAQIDDLYYDPAVDGPLYANRNNQSDRGRNDRYYDEDEDYDYYYTSRIQRFHRPYRGFSYYDPCYTDPLYYDAIWTPSFSVIVNTGWGLGPSWGWYRPWRPWNTWSWGGWGWNRWDNWGWYYGGWNRWNNWGPAWSGGFYDPFWGGWGGWGSPVFVNNHYYNAYNPYNGWHHDGWNGGGGTIYQPRNVYYGPRKTGSITTGPAPTNVRGGGIIRRNDVNIRPETPREERVGPRDDNRATNPPSRRNRNDDIRAPRTEPQQPQRRMDDGDTRPRREKEVAPSRQPDNKPVRRERGGDEGYTPSRSEYREPSRSYERNNAPSRSYESPRSYSPSRSSTPSSPAPSRSSGGGGGGGGNSGGGGHRRGG